MRVEIKNERARIGFNSGFLKELQGQPALSCSCGKRLGVLKPLSRALIGSHAEAAKKAGDILNSEHDKIVAMDHLGRIAGAENAADVLRVRAADAAGVIARVAHEPAGDLMAFLVDADHHFASHEVAFNGLDADREKRRVALAVSYTHLTLPTILLV